VNEIATQNASNEAAVQEIAAGMQALDDSEDPVAARKAELVRLQTRREEVVKTATATRTRAEQAAKRQDDDASVIKAANEERQHADKTLRALDDLKARLAQVGERLDKAAVAEPTKPADKPKKKKK
jgi:hypothetical protein